MNTNDTQPLPSVSQLIKATLIAIAASLVILISAILPAEYGVDPIGAGKLFGLMELSASDDNLKSGVITDAVADELAVPAVVPVSTDVNHNNERKRLVLEPGRGIELKAAMRKGEQFIFNWEAEGGVYVDMHGEPPNAKDDEFTSYWIDKKSESAKGVFVAPFDGTHGWYWRNRTDKPVVINIEVSGFFDKLYIP